MGKVSLVLLALSAGLLAMAGTCPVGEWGGWMNMAGAGLGAIGTALGGVSLNTARLARKASSTNPTSPTSSDLGK